MRAQNVKGEWFEMTGEDLLARAFQHEIDHLQRHAVHHPRQRPEAGSDQAQDPQTAKAGEWELSAADAASCLPGHARVRRAHAGTDRRSRPRSARRVHAARPAQGPRPAARGFAGEGGGAAARAPGLPAGADPAAGGRRANSRGIGADAMVVVGYGQIIPQSIIDIPPLGIINVHASLLPKYRGAAPIQWAIANGETRTGVTTMRIDAGLDTGDMLLKAETEIGPEETAIELGARLARCRRGLAGRNAGRACGRHYCPQPQDDSQATLAPILKKEDGRIDLAQPARDDPEPDARLSAVARNAIPFRGQRFHIWKARCDRHARSPESGVDGKRLLRRMRRGHGDRTARSAAGRAQAHAAAAFLNGIPSGEERGTGTRC